LAMGGGRLRHAWRSGDRRRRVRLFLLPPGRRDLAGRPMPTRGHRGRVGCPAHRAGQRGGKQPPGGLGSQRPSCAHQDQGPLLGSGKRYQRSGRRQSTGTLTRRGRGSRCSGLVRRRRQGQGTDPGRRASGSGKADLSSRPDPKTLRRFLSQVPHGLKKPFRAHADFLRISP
jgi:hypothetical protein